MGCSASTTTVEPLDASQHRNPTQPTLIAGSTNAEPMPAILPRPGRPTRDTAGRRDTVPSRGNAQAFPWQSFGPAPAMPSTPAACRSAGTGDPGSPSALLRRDVRHSAARAPPASREAQVLRARSGSSGSNPLLPHGYRQSAHIRSGTPVVFASHAPGRRGRGSSDGFDDLGLAQIEAQLDESVRIIAARTSGRAP